MTRSPLLLAVVAAALALGACGSSDDGGGSKGSSRASQQDKAFEGALKFSKCMRDHGVDFPDPQRAGSGGIKLTAKNINPNDPKTKAAQQACQKYMQIGGLTFQAGPGGGKKSSGPRGGLGATPDSPKFQAADKACSHFLGDLGEAPGTDKETDG